jgi:hypothetical protein
VLVVRRVRQVPDGQIPAMRQGATLFSMAVFGSLAGRFSHSFLDGPPCPHRTAGVTREMGTRRFREDGHMAGSGSTEVRNRE